MELNKGKKESEDIGPDTVSDPGPDEVTPVEGPATGLDAGKRSAAARAWKARLRKGKK